MRGLFEQAYGKPDAATDVAPDACEAVADTSITLADLRRVDQWRLVSCHRSNVVGCAQPSERSARRIAQPIPSVLASDATPRCASMASADRQMIGDATLEYIRLGDDDHGDFLPVWGNACMMLSHPFGGHHPPSLHARPIANCYNQHSCWQQPTATKATTFQEASSAHVHAQG
ncbi:hypothetical protein Veis_0506 [Verminephrobacter eiseniae EF01-2]|uniref:Uncharacterized protein n=1 Tax=Verminephrobacter eiseniae (strain EF01-2) TaxID=391735 RepID=A1WF83_VEREI|nr:hypothetical protein Veis_0506 [Verminephrobacter eiseniae EF01-2]